MPWFLGHYSQFATRIFCHDNGSTDRTREIVAACPIAEVLDFESGGEMRDDVHQQVKDNAWKCRGADWVICVDADEFLHSPQCLMEEALRAYRRAGNAVPRATGYQMSAPALPDYEPGAKLTDFIKTGVADAHYSKPCVFDATRIAEMNYTPRAHDCRPTLRDGGAVVPVDAVPPRSLLHFKYAYGLECLLRRHEALLERLSETNRRHGWGS